jgi:lipopolysaccharide/colanic/teichoic acid biosynthesis glycosyltransferase
MSNATVRGPYRGKRAFDLAILAAAAVPGMAVGLACAIAVKAGGPGPVFFRQERAGLAGRPFRVWKFRTMGDVPAGDPFPDADRITGVGRWLRRLSLDELPQLLNVARGEMSIIGPRPTLPYQVERYTPRQRGRLAVRPGITGLAQVRGRNAIGWADRIEMDLEYVRRQSAWLDLRILAWTVGAVVRGSGVEGHPRDDPIAADPPSG